MKANYDKFPSIKLEGQVFNNWADIIGLLPEKGIIAIECYPGVNISEIKNAFQNSATYINSDSFFKPEDQILALTQPDVTDDIIFGFITRLKLVDFVDQTKLAAVQKQIKSNNGLTVVCGPGALLCVPDADLKIYADMARWEIQLRMRRKEVNGLGVTNCELPFSHQYKRGYFVDWRVCDQFKKEWFNRCDYLLDTNKANQPKLVTMDTIREGLAKTVTQPFRLVPFFDPGPWGGHWMEEVCDLDKTDVPNHAWCFDCVPEENSLLFNVDGEIIEIPSIDVVFFQSKKLLGDAVEARFGQEFPIRFDFLDTMGGGNLSLQVHPDTNYIQQNFGLNYTQDESYYMLDTNENAKVYLGLKTDINPVQMINELYEAQEGGASFDAEKHVNVFPAKKHDHFLIPAGTVHCSGQNSMVLEISATPYIFTFKIWDWDRLGMDGKPRPINIKHASKVIDWTRNTEFATRELVNQVVKVAEGDGWVEERTGLHEREFIETRRHWFSKPVHHYTSGGVNVINLIEGREAVVESPANAFAPFVVHYAETFVIPAAVGEYVISPCGESKGKTIGTLKAFVRTNA